jgi:hypothetical protein
MVVIIYLVFHCHFFNLVVQITPISGKFWAGYFAPWAVTRRVKEDCYDLGERYAADVSAVFQALQPPKQPTDGAGGLSKSMPAGLQPPRSRDELRDFLTDALPDMEPVRVKHAAMSMQSEGLTLALLKKVSSRDNSNLVMNTLENDRLHLTCGEVLQIMLALDDRPDCHEPQPPVPLSVDPPPPASLPGDEPVGSESNSDFHPSFVGRANTSS